MSLLGVFAAIAVVQFLAAASPGPSFIVVSSHESGGSRKTALFSALGVLMATVTWVGLAVVGLGAVLSAAKNNPTQKSGRSNLESSNTRPGFPNHVE